MTCLQCVGGKEAGGKLLFRGPCGAEKTQRSSGVGYKRFTGSQGQELLGDTELIQWGHGKGISSATDGTRRDIRDHPEYLDHVRQRVQARQEEGTRVTREVRCERHPRMSGNQE